MSTSRMEGLDLFRGSAAVAVVFFHSWKYLSIPWIQFAFVAVDLFFVLSGIVLAVKYTAEIADGMKFREFAAARLQRLYPMVFIAGVFVAILNWVRVPNGFLSVSATQESAWRIFLVWPHYQEAPHTDAFPSDGPMWSLWAELAINALWFPIMKYRPRLMGPIGVLAMLSMLALTWHLQRLSYGFESGTLYRLMALLRAFAWFSVGYWIGRSTGRAVPVLPALLALLGVIAGFVLTQHGGVRTHLIIIAMGCVLLHSLYHSPGVWPPLRGLSKMLGLISYPLYLIHAVAGRLLPREVGPLERWLALVLIVGGIAVAATLLNEWVVARIRQFVRQRRASSQSAASPLLLVETASWHRRRRWPGRPG